MPGQVPDIAMRTETSKAIQGLSHVFTDTAAPVTRIPTEAIPDHDIGIFAIITGVVHTAQTPHTGVTAIDLAMTLHLDCTTDHPHTEAYHITPGIEACHVHIHHTKPHDESHISHTHTPVNQEANHITRRTPEWG